MASSEELEKAITDCSEVSFDIKYDVDSIIHVFIIQNLNLLFAMSNYLLTYFLLHFLLGESKIFRVRKSIS
jgi:hypothetical protein